MKIILVKKTNHYCFTLKFYDEQLLNKDITKLTLQRKSLHFFVIVHKLKIHIDPTYILVIELFN